MRRLQGWHESTHPRNRSVRDALDERGFELRWNASWQQAEIICAASAAQLTLT
jgi:hypothetical protein